MRLRLLVPRRGRGRGLGGLTRRRTAAALLIAALAAVAAIVVAGSAPEEGEPPPSATVPSPTPAATPAATPPPATRLVEGDGELAVGITEPNPSFYREGAVPPEFDRWRAELRALRPSYYRFVVDWPNLASPDGRRLDPGRLQPGCMRDVLPCSGWAGLREQLQALAAVQRAEPGRWQGMAVITGTPAALAAAPSGCERAGTEPRSRAPRPQATRAYRRMLRTVMQEVRAAGADVRYWSPWNEPNHPYGMSPQRTACEAGAASAIDAPYTRLARAMRAELRDQPGDQELVLGETAGLLDREAGYVDVAQFIRELPRDVVCAATVYGQHGYVGGPDPVDAVARALRRHRCPRTHAIWITETGAGAARMDLRRPTSAPALQRACRAMRRRLLRWYDDPRVTAAFQYTLREDDRFPTGLVTVDLRRAYPTLREWQAWSDREPTAPPPRSRC